jgi:hypothetical protein
LTAFHLKLHWRMCYREFRFARRSAHTNDCDPAMAADWAFLVSV